MLAIAKREIISFFTSSMGYLIVGLFLALIGLFLWVFKGPFNIIDFGFMDLSSFFLLAPWILLLFVPALTMKTFSEEKNTGNLELLFIKPLSITQTVLGKFFGLLIILIITLLPTLLYVFSISKLGIEKETLDLGVVIGSYFGLSFLISTYIAIGVFVSSLTGNQILCFILSVVLCFIFFYGFEAVATVVTNGNLSYAIRSFGMKFHFEGIARGILDTKDLIYFGSLTLFFVFLTVVQLKYHDR